MSDSNILRCIIYRVLFVGMKLIHEAYKETECVVHPGEYCEVLNPYEIIS